MTNEEREAVKRLMIKYGFKAPDMTVTEFVEDCLPSVQPTRPTGKWVYKMQVMNNPYTYQCSVCKGWGRDKTKYCPNCGARMAESEDKE